MTKSSEEFDYFSGKGENAAELDAICQYLIHEMFGFGSIKLSNRSKWQKQRRRRLHLNTYGRKVSEMANVIQTKQIKLNFEGLFQLFGEFWIEWMNTLLITESRDWKQHLFPLETEQFEIQSTHSLAGNFHITFHHSEYDKQ
jgi:hypothetical protein